MAYKLDLPLSLCIHPIFHVSLLKKKLGNHEITSPTLPPILPEGDVQWKPKKVLELGMVKQKDAAVVRWLVQWQRFSQENATWEDAIDIQTRFPEF